MFKRTKRQNKKTQVVCDQQNFDWQSYDRQEITHKKREDKKINSNNKFETRKD